ncbi:MAG TPA: hypothetical protein VNK67_03190 [Burkholderiales bacterium]|nr:hypothetical protein [Burkholderiales bacterium]
MKAQIANCRLRLKCLETWDRLQSFGAPNARFCTACERLVFLCRTYEEYRGAVSMGRCVAIPIDDGKRDGFMLGIPDDAL